MTLSTVHCKITLAFLGGKEGFSSWCVVAPFSYRSLNWGSPHTWSNLISLLLVVLQASNGLWYQMNDSIVSTSDIRSVLSQQAYVLFYIRYCQESAFPPFLLSQKEHFTDGPVDLLHARLPQTLNLWKIQYLQRAVKCGTWVHFLGKKAPFPSKTRGMFPLF